MVACLSTAAFAQGQFEAKMLPDLYTMKMSPAGNIIASYVTENTMLYNVETGTVTEITDFQPGNGNAFTADGKILVGSTSTTQPVIVIGSESNIPENLAGYELCALNGITADGSRICGLVNTKSGTPMYVPAIFEVDANGKVSDPVILPYPEKDIFGTAPQYVSAVWISADGKRVLGQVVADNGMFMYPISYTQNADNSWSYAIVGENLLNPNNIVMPENPGDFEMDAPQYTDFMTEEEKAAYVEAENKYIESGYDPSLEPNPADYMTPEEIEAYNKYTDEFNAYAEEYNNKLEAYQNAMFDIIESSANYVQNGFTLSADGNMGAAATELMVEDPNSDPEWPTVVTYNPLYILDLNENTATEIKTENKTVIPEQILPYGVVLGTTPIPGPLSSTVLPPSTFIWYAGLNDWMSLNEWLGKGDAAVADWMANNLTHNIPVPVDENYNIINDDVLMTGHAQVSDDFSVISGGLFAYLYDDVSEYESYLITGAKSGVESAVADANGELTALNGGILSVNGTVTNVAVYDLAGATLYTAASLSGTVATGLPEGFYVVRYTNGQGRKVSEKVRF